MICDEEAGGGVTGTIGREGEVGREGSSGARERQEGRSTAEEDPLTRSWVEVPLTKGRVAKIDRADMLIVGRWRWQAYVGGRYLWYASRTIRVNGRRTSIGMHRWIMDPPPGVFIDHINGDGLDNRRANLRLCTQGQNNSNKKRPLGRAARASRYIGVRRADSIRDAWEFSFCCNHVHIYRGGFATAEMAAKAYDDAVVRSRGEFAVTNFPMGVGRSLYPEIA